MFLRTLNLDQQLRSAALALNATDRVKPTGLKLGETHQMLKLTSKEGGDVMGNWQAIDRHPGTE